MPITWRNVDAPSFTGVQQGLEAAGQSFQRALGTLGGMAEQQRDLNIQEQQKQRSDQTQAAIEALSAAAQDVESYDKLNFADTVKQFGDINREKAFKFYEGLEDDLYKDQKQKLEFNRLANQADKEEYLNSATTAITDAYAKGFSSEEIKKTILPNLAKGKYSSDVYGVFNRLDKERNSLTVQQQRQYDFLNQEADSNYANVVGSLDAEQQQVTQQYPVDDTLTPKQEVQSISETKSYMSKVAPKEGLVRWGTRGGGEGIYLHEVLDEDIKRATRKIKAQLPEDQRSGYELNPQAIQMAVEAMPISEDGEMDTSKLYDTILDYERRIRQNERNRTTRAALIADIVKRKQDAAKQHRDTLYSNMQSVKNLF